MVSVKLYCSVCGRNDYYLERVEAVAKKLGLNIEAEKVTDEAAWRALDLEESCLFAYCPGCKRQHEEVRGKVLPALEVNGELWFWNVPATDEQLERCLSAFAR